MAHHKVYLGFLILAITAIHRVQMTCVFDSDFGFKLNCAFKKSGLFRVRNLGGIKAHVGLGFSVGDELGFDQSLTNLDTNKRRSTSFTNGSPLNSLAALNQQSQQKSTRNNQNNNVKKNRLTVRQPSTSTTASIQTIALPESATERLAVQSGRSQGSVMRQLQHKPASSIPPFKPIPPAKSMVAPNPTSQSYTQYPIPNQNQRIQSSPINQNRIGQSPNSNYVSLSAAPPRIVNAADQALRTVPAPVMSSYPQFAAMPASISRISDPKSPSMSVVTSQIYKNGVQIPVAPTMMNRAPNLGSFGANTISLNKIPTASAYSSQKPAQKIDNMIAYNVVSGHNGFNDYSPQSSLQQKIAALSRATNISVETIEAAVRLRQNQLIQQMINAATTTPAPTAATTTRPPPPPPPVQTAPPKRYQQTTQPPQPASKVMNAPKEYYPVGYDKNYDDNFVSKVDLPETTFYCGDQKHFPGLYGDEDLGCMVFHVCALTDDGLIMKSFLCPESTLFDQTILKCNWWFYVDCKSSKRLYDSNIPISKSYQLMKALTFFSSYKKDTQSNEQNAPTSSIEENPNGVNNAVKILQEKAQMHLPKVEIAEVNKTEEVMRGSKYFIPVNANEVNALSVVPKRSSENTSAEKDDKAKRYRGRIRTSTVKTITEKSIEKSTSVIRKRPHTSYKVADLKDSDESKSSEEVNDVASTTVSSQKVTIDEVTGSSGNQIIKSDNPEKVHDTIVKMDEAIIGHK